MGRQHSLSDTSIHKRAKAKGWTRDLSFVDRGSRPYARACARGPAIRPPPTWRQPASSASRSSCASTALQIRPSVSARRRTGGPETSHRCRAGASGPPQRRAPPPHRQWRHRTARLREQVRANPRANQTFAHPASHRARPHPCTVPDRFRGVEQALIGSRTRARGAQTPGARPSRDATDGSVPGWPASTYGVPPLEEGQDPIA
jgi:hypothetical protein